MVWFLLLFPLLNIWESMHFYFIHRLLHYKPFYRWHAPHHRNINIGPWSGFSMHPIEHVLYFSTILIHLVVASHPIHMLYHMYFTALAAVVSHTGYSGILVKEKKAVDLGDFFHQLHHRYFDCNYGTAAMPGTSGLARSIAARRKLPPRCVSISSLSAVEANVRQRSRASSSSRKRQQTRRVIDQDSLQLLFGNPFAPHVVGDHRRQKCGHSRSRRICPGDVCIQHRATPSIYRRVPP